MKKTIRFGVLRLLSVYVAVALIVSLFSCVSSLSVLASTDEYSTENYAGGDGTKAAPYRIKTAGQLYKMVKEGGKKDGARAYFVMENDIYLNDVSDWSPDKENTKGYKNWNNAATASDVVGFTGSFDGGGHTIYGLYSNNTYHNGFIPLVSENDGSANVQNVNFTNAFVYGRYWVGTVIGAGYGGAAFSNIIVTDATVKEYDWASSGGILGTVSWGKVCTFTNCAVIDTDSNGIIMGGSADQATNTMSGCWGAGNTATDYSVSSKNRTVSNCYIIDDSSKIKGEDAKTAMPNLDWDDIWQTGKDGEYPKLAAGADGTVEYDGGDGSQRSPYLISNKKQLYRMISEGGMKDSVAAYYTLTENISLNDTENWAPDAQNTKNYKIWDTTSAPAFCGVLNGQGCTVSGLYIKGDGFIRSAADGASVSNVIFENIYVSGNAWVGSVVGTAGNITVSNVMVKNSHLVRSANWGNRTGGIIGLVNDGKTTYFTNCAVIGSNAEGAFSGCAEWNTANQVITGSFAVECPAASRFCAGYTKNVSAQNSYFVTDASAIKGSAAEDAMPALEWNSVWKAGKDGDYPSLWFKDWNGKTATKPELRDENAENSADNPYEIYLAAELYWLAKNYKTATGWYELCADIYLNDVNGFSESQPWWDSEKINKWYTESVDFADGFKGVLNGNFRTVYGLYADAGSDSDNAAGLFMSLGDGAVVKNLTVAKAKLSADGGYAAAIAACVADNAVVTVENCLVDSTAEISGADESGVVAVVGKKAKLNVVSSAFTGTISKNSAAIVGKALSGAKAEISGCFAPFDSLSGAKDTVYLNSYQIGKSSDDGIESVTKDNMMGLSVKITGMPKIDFDNVWLAQSDDYPVLRNPEKYGIEGGVWSGDISEDFAINSLTGKRGNGTKINPYIIKTGEQLYRMMTVREDDAYYELGADIYLNDTSAQDWYTAGDVRQWINVDTGKESANGGWKLHLEGNGYTVNGLYCNATGWRSTGLIPMAGDGTTVTNVHIRNSYYTGPEVAYGVKADNYIGGIAGYIAPSANVVIGGCTLDGTVLFVGGDKVGGIVAGNAGSGLLIEQCGFSGVIQSGGRYVGGIYGDVWAATRINYCYTVGSIVGGKDGNTHAKASYVYTTEDQTQSTESSKLNVTRLENEYFFADKAKEYIMFDWTQWEFVSGFDYPFPRYSLKGVDGVQGGIWSGNTASNYQPYTSDYDYPKDRGLEVSPVDGTVIDPINGDYYYGDGTDKYPYHIATGEQLAKMVKENCRKDVAAGLDVKRSSFILVADIYLNDVNDPNWTSSDNKNAHDWLTGDYSVGFRGHFSGEGHLVYGMRLVGNRDWVITGLIPVIGEGAVVEKVGIVDAYVNNESKIDTYVGGISGYVQHYTGYVDTEEDIARDGLEANGLKDPVIRECFVYNSYFASKNAGGILGGMPDPITIEDCYFTGTVSGTGNKYGGIVGNCWAGGALYIKSTYSLSTDYCRPIGGDAALGSSVYGGYVYTKEQLTKFKLKHPMNMYGESAYKHLPEFFENSKTCWQVVEGGTPVLSVFGNRAKNFTFNTPIYTTVSFTTNVENLILDSVTGVFGDPLTLPKPTREGYKFGGWYYYPELQCEAQMTVVPRTSINLFAKWIKECVTQDFENYTDTSYDRDLNGDYKYYKIGLENYDSAYVHGGAKSMHRMGKTDKEEDILVNFEETLKVGTKYKMTYWVCTDTDGSKATVSLVHNSWPDINLEKEPAKGIEKITDLKNMKNGVWKQYTHYFTAKTEWVSIRTTGNASLYFDDIMIVSVGGSGTIARTGDSSFPITVMISAFAVSAVLIILSGKKLITDTKTQIVSDD